MTSSLPHHSLNPRHRLLHLSCRREQIIEQPRVNLRGPFVFQHVANVMGARQYAPHPWAQRKRMGQRLEDDVSVVRAVASMTQRGECEGVRRVVRKIKAAVRRQGSVRCIVQPRSAGRESHAAVTRAVARGWTSEAGEQKCHLTPK